MGTKVKLEDLTINHHAAKSWGLEINQKAV